MTYTVDDGTGRTDTATVTITVTPVPDAPVAADDTATVAEDGSVVVDVRANDGDVDGETARRSPPCRAPTAPPPTDGASVTYFPNPDSNGTHTVTYTVDDGTGRTDTATVTITVTPVPDAPVAADDTATVAEDGSVVVDVRANDGDVDGEQPHGHRRVGSPPADGTATHRRGQLTTHFPNPHSNGTHTVTYTVDDGTGRTDTATVTITVTPCARRTRLRARQ